jgi:hypothetical protein
VSYYLEPNLKALAGPSDFSGEIVVLIETNEERVSWVRFRASKLNAFPGLLNYLLYKGILLIID